MRIRTNLHSITYVRNGNIRLYKPTSQNDALGFLNTSISSGGYQYRHHGNDEKVNRIDKEKCKQLKRSPEPPLHVHLIKGNPQIDQNQRDNDPTRIQVCKLIGQYNVSGNRKERKRMDMQHENQVFYVQTFSPDIQQLHYQRHEWQ